MVKFLGLIITHFCFQLSQRYVVQKPEFINVPAGVLEDLSDQGTDKSVLEAEDAAMAEQADYQVCNVVHYSILCRSICSGPSAPKGGDSSINIRPGFYRI